VLNSASDYHSEEWSPIVAEIPEFSLSGMTAVVTGGGRSIGRGTAVALAQAGANVVVAGRDRGTLDAVAQEISGVGAKALAIPCDVRKDEDISSLIAATVSSFGQLDIMVANAGIFQKWASSEHFSLSEWEDIYATNLRGAMMTCMAAGRQMLQQESGGAIITISSIQGVTSIEGTMAYTAAKHGVIGMTKTLAVDWATRNVRVNAIAPGFIARDDEPLMRDEAAIKFVKGRTPMQRWGTPREVGLAVCFLASPAASYITGAVLAVDGGWLAH
jgi:NAD(P)-dependent dehydrogenase (short-subunit alcohol dehydrogenase family)